LQKSLLGLSTTLCIEHCYDLKLEEAKSEKVRKPFLPKLLAHFEPSSKHGDRLVEKGDGFRTYRPHPKNYGIRGIFALAA
jgi:hypothetical protein